MHKYYIFLGHNSKLSTLEVSSLSRSNPTPIKDGIVSAELDDKSLTRIKDKSGGVVKIAKHVKDSSRENALVDIKEILKKATSKNAAISDEAGVSISPSDIKSLKDEIKKTKPIRFIDLHTREHSLVAIKKQHVTELSVIKDGDDIALAETIWIHDFEGWTKRDRKKPYRAIQRGMMSPKLARSMINVATEGKKSVVLDPFCGTGTVGLESLLLGNETHLRDNDKGAVEGTRKNVEWLRKQYEVVAPSSVDLLDATHSDEEFSALDAVVTEPFMGPLFEEKNDIITLGGNPLSQEKLENIITGLDKLYKGSLKSFHKSLKSGGRVVMVVPEFNFRGKIYGIPLIDTCENLGYNMLDLIRHGRSDSTVIRNILILEKNGKN